MKLPETTSSSIESFDYKLLRGHDKTDGSYKSDEQLQMEYLQRTDALIQKMTEGIDTVNGQTGEIENHIPDVVIFLDKSARPLAWLTNELWDKFAADSDGKVADKPDFRFLNIDKEQWKHVLDPENMGKLDVGKMKEEDIASLRSIFVQPQYRNDVTRTAAEKPTSLDGKTVLIVDEVYATGKTMETAKMLLSRAFPSANIGGTHWMGGLVQKGFAVGNADLPVWYDVHSEFGRGVANRGKTKPITDVQRQGARFLSSRFDEVDTRALQLRKELKHLARNPDVPYRPSADRDDYIERVERYNNRPFVEVQPEILAIASLKKRH